MEVRRFRWKADAPVIGWCVFVLYMSVLPSDELPSVLIQTNDLVLHVGVYIIWMIFALYGVVVRSKRLLRSAVRKQLLIALSFSFLVELIQEFGTSNRTFSWLDLLSNAIGCILGVLIFRSIYYLSSNRKEME